MRLPGTRYQEHGWEQVRTLLGHASLQAFAHCSPAALLDAVRAPAALALYIDLTAEALQAGSRSARAAAPGNSYGESVHELALSLLYELQARPGDWAGVVARVADGLARLAAPARAPLHYNLGVQS